MDRVKKIAIVGFLFFLLIGQTLASASSIEDVFHVGVSESIVAKFDIPGSGTSTKLYRDYVRLTLDGFGQSKGQELNDAFYFFTNSGLYDNGNLLNNGLLHISFTGDARQVEADGIHIINYIKFIDGQGFVNYSRPNYSIDHSYDFVINVGSDYRRLTLGTGDGGLGDNTGQFNIKISQAVVTPEPVSMVLFSVGGIALAAYKRRKKTV